METTEKIAWPESMLDKAPDKNYVLSKELKIAVETAIALNQPLLVTGEPGVGKTMLAYKIAMDLDLNKPFVFNSKTTSIASELLYTYDALRHFQDVNLNKELCDSVSKERYVCLNALGEAIALTNGVQLKNGIETKVNPGSSVVLIDEIDKAPRDFPNDLLNEIDNYQFIIKELNNRRFSLNKDYQIVVVITSNSEKSLPEPFLRRCIYYNIPYPDREALKKIVSCHIEDSTYSDDELINHFEEIRKLVKFKKPSSAELIAWLKILGCKNFINGKKIDFNKLTDEQKTILRMSYSIIIKNNEDLQAIASNIR